MALRKPIAALLVLGLSLLCAGSATAAFPNFSDCPRSDPDVTVCLDVQSVSGSLEIKGFTVPLGESLEIRGGANTGTRRFIPPAGTTGFFSRAIRVPGGILGIEFPIPGNAVLAIAQLAGPPSAVVVETGFPTTLRLPVKVKLENPILGGNCYIGTNSNPSRMNLTTGTTSPPPPNRPITGSIGEPSLEGEPPVLKLLGATNVDNAFAVPGASGCGLFGIVDPLVNLRLRLPSAAGNNTMIVRNNIALTEA